MIYLRQSTASQEIMLGQFVDSTDGSTAMTGLTIANTDIRMQKAGSTSFANKNSGGATHVESGYYSAVLDATDTDTLGSGLIKVVVAGALVVQVRFAVLPAQVFDSLILGSDLLDVTISAAEVRAAVGLASANLDTQLSTIDTVVDSILVDTAVIGAAGAGLTAIPWNAAWDAEVQSEVTDALNAYDGPTNAEMEARTLVAANYATAAALATVDGIVDDILVDTGTTIPATLGTLATASALATVDANVDEILIDTGTTLPSTLATIAGYLDTEIASIKAVTDKLDTTVELDSTVYRFTTNALENAPAGGGGGSSDWTTTEKEQIRHRLGIDGDTDAPSATPSLATAAAVATVDTVVDAIQAKTDALPSDPADASVIAGRFDTLDAAVDAVPTATENADALLNRDMSAVSDTNSRTPLNALRFLRNRWSVSGTTLTVTKENDSTSAWTSQVTTNVAAEPITGSDPA